MGLDISTKRTGVVVATVQRGELVQLFRDSVIVEGKGFVRAHRIAQKIADLITVHEPDNVVIEGYAYGNLFSLATLVEVGTLVRLAVWQCGRYYLDPAPGTLKKFVTGKGTCQKEQMILEVYKRWGISALNHDEADALGLAAMGLAYMNALKVPQYGLEALAVCKKHDRISLASEA